MIPTTSWSVATALASSVGSLFGSGKMKSLKRKNEDLMDEIATHEETIEQMNHYLKDLCELCEFNTPITSVFYRAGQKVEETYPKWALVGTHAGRRTFICFALSSGVPPQVVMKWTGHSDYKAMKPYIDITEKTKADAMKLIDNAWNS